MKYNQELLDDIMTDAMHGFSLIEIANRLGISINEFLIDFNDETMQVKAYYNAGRAKGKIETDTALYALAKNGSSTAKKEYDQKMAESELSNKLLEIFNS